MEDILSGYRLSRRGSIVAHDEKKENKLASKMDTTHKILPNRAL